MSAPSRTGFERRFDLEPGEGRMVLDLLGSAIDASADPRARGVIAALDADRSLGEGLGLPAGSGEVLYARATQWFAVGRADRAEPLFRMLCLLDGSVADHWVGHGVCLHLGDQVEAAGLAFRTAEALRPDWAIPCFHLAALAVRGQRWNEARSWLERFRDQADESVPPSMRREAARLEAMVQTALGAVP